MDIFTKYDSKTWLKDVGFPCIRIVSPDGENIYSGRNPMEFFKVFDISFYLDHHIQIFIEEFKWIELGMIKEFKEMPEFELKYKTNSIERKK